VSPELPEPEKVAQFSALWAGALALPKDDADIPCLQNNMHSFNMCPHIDNTWIKSQCNPAGDMLDL
jgi:hypothetical protein